jgi:hypothetical protein
VTPSSVVVILVALASLAVVNVAGPQDRTRYELTRHVALHGTLTVEDELFDRAVYGGRSYSDKAPGISFAAVPAFELERATGIARAPRAWSSEGDASLWLMRVLTSGVLFLAMVLVVGRLAEESSPGTGAATMAILGVATLASPLAPTLFEHDAAAALGIGAFALVKRRHLVAAGLCAGGAVLFQYAIALVALALLVYAAIRFGRRALWLVLGALPAAAALGAYDDAAFGSPFHLSYRYVANAFAERQHHGFFGIGIPTADGVWQALGGTRGLLVTSPVALAAAGGLVLLWRSGHRLEAGVAGAITIAFVLLDAGYFLPYGGTSPGPRFLVPALPFLALGLPVVLARYPRPTLALAAVSAALIAVDAMTWSLRGPNDRSILPTRGDVAQTVWSELGLNRDIGAIVVLGCALAAVAVGGRALVRRPA